MTKFVGVIGSGNIGRDPFDPRSFSGISRSLFLALQDQGALARAFGVEVPVAIRYMLMARNFRPTKRLWRTAFYLDTAYYRALTEAVRRSMDESDSGSSILQLGAYYDVPSLVDGGTRCLSYHDGNVAQMMSSPYFPSELRRAAEKAFEWERRVYEGLDAICAMSDYLRRSFIEDFGVPEDKVWNVGAGANFEIPEVLPDKDFSTKKILFVGIDFDRKGGNQLVEAFAIVREMHPDAELHIVGPRTRPDVLTQDPKGVTFHGLLSRQDPEERETFFRLMQDSTLFVLPSRYEPYGVAVIEAMAYGMPVIATNRWAFPEMLDATGLLVELDDVHGLADRIDWMLQDPDRREALGRRARDRVLEGYGWDKVARRLVEIADGIRSKASQAR